MQTKRRLTFAIHDLNPFGGHDRSTLEIARRLSHRFGVNLFAYSVTDPQGLNSWGDVRVLRVWPYFRKPAFALISYFYLASILFLGLYSKIKKFFTQKPTPLIHATGACSCVSDVVQVQFVNAAWKEIRKTLPPEVYQAPHSRTGNAFKKLGLQTYHEAMLHYDAAVEHLVYRHSKTYIAISHQVKHELERFFGIPKEKIHVIHHGVDGKIFFPVNEGNRAEREQLRAELGIRPDEVAVSFVGAYERKGLSLALEGMSRLPHDTQSKVKLLAVGSGAIEGFQARSRALGLSDRVIFVQHKKEVAPYYRASDLFLLPTLYEPFGLVILEAMASGLPCVVSAQAGGAELIRHGESGFLIQNPRDADEIASLLLQLVNDPALRARFGKNARTIAIARSWDQVAEEYSHVLGPLLLQ